MCSTPLIFMWWNWSVIVLSDIEMSVGFIPAGGSMTE